MQNIIFNLGNISNIVIYCRVSSKKQSDDTHTGLKTQYSICLEYIKNNELYKNIDIGVIEEIGSSYNNQNALMKLDKILTIMETNTLILIHDTSRFGRNIYQTNRDCEKVDLKKSYIISVTEQICFGLNRITDQTFFQKLNEAEMFSNIQSERAKNRFKILKENGEYFGRAPFGKMIIKNDEDKRVLVDNPPEQEMISNLKISLIDNKESIYTVNHELIRTNALNQFWPLSKLKRIIKNYMTPEEQKKVNYKYPEISTESIKRGRDIEKDIVKIGYGLRKCKLNK